MSSSIIYSCDRKGCTIQSSSPLYELKVIIKDGLIIAGRTTITSSTVELETRTYHFCGAHTEELSNVIALPHKR